MRLTRFFRRKRRDVELTQELESYLAHEIDDGIAAGMDSAEARFAAMRKVGNLSAAREAVYEMNTLALLEGTWRDLRFGLRQLLRSPVFTAAAIISLALGIGANSSIFQLLNAVSIRNLPVPKPEQLAMIRVVGEGRWGRQTGRNRQVSNPLWEQIRDHQQAFSGLFAWNDTRFNLAPQGEIRYVEGLWVSGNFFPVLGIKPALGRLIAPEDDRRGCGYPGAVISHSLWQREFGGRPDVVGQMLYTGVQSVPVIGVTPQMFFGVEVGRRFEVAMPICSAGFEAPDHWWLGLMGRLKPGWTLEKANAHLASIAPGTLAATVPPSYRPDTVAKYLTMKYEAVPASAGASQLRRGAEKPLWLLMAITGLVLLIASANLANLMLARASAREQEFAVRLAIGGSRGRIVRQVLAESLLLTAIGGAAGVLIARWSSDFLVSLLSTSIDPIYLDLTMDGRLLGFTAAVACLACVLFGLAPAIGATRASTAGALGGRGASAGRQRYVWRRVLVATQVGLSFVLVCTALLFTGSFRNLMTVEAGFRRDGVLFAHLFFRQSGFPIERREPFYRTLTERLRAIPGVTGVAYASSPPLSGLFWDTSVKVDGKTEGVSNVNQVSAGYFRVMGTPLLAGRDFDERDTPGSQKVAVVSEAFVRKFFKGASPLSRTFAMPNAPGQPDAIFQVVGLVKDSKYYDLREEFQPIMFIASSQDRNTGLTRRYAVHSTRPLGEVMSSIRLVVEEARPGTSLRFASFQTQVAESLLRERLLAALSGFFGILAVLLAVVGLYGVLSYLVERRRKELGIRIALGASRSGVLRMILGEVALLLAGGLAAGLAIAIPSVKAATSLLYGLEPHDPWTVVSAIVLMTVAGLAAGFIPAVKASGVEPVEALRDS
ncbi:MAG: ADOP family duplicated permease [Bryobacteraceae bacterium]